MAHDPILVSANDVIEALPEVDAALKASVAMESISIQITYSLNKNPAVIIAELKPEGYYKLTPALVMYETLQEQEIILLEWAPRQWLDISKEELMLLMLMTEKVKIGPLPKMPKVYAS